jgi:hypothetical protein
MKLNRRKLKKLIMEELSKLNEAPNPSFMQEVLEALKYLGEPYEFRIEGDKIVCYGLGGDDVTSASEVEFEVIFK